MSPSLKSTFEPNRAEVKKKIRVTDELLQELLKQKIIDGRNISNIEAAQSDDDRAERLLKTLEQCESELVDFYTALVAAGQRDVVNLLRRNELLFSSFNG